MNSMQKTEAIDSDIVLFVTKYYDDIILIDRYELIV